jgi:hypothetical protein
MEVASLLTALKGESNDASEQIGAILWMTISG